MLSSSPRRIGNQLCFADLRPTKRPGGSTDNPEDPRTRKAVERHTTTTMPPPLPRCTRATRFFLRRTGPIIGRQAIQKWFTDLFQWWHPKNSMAKVDGNAFHLIGTAGNELWATGE